MNSRILAERTARAILAIQAETERLGGKLELPTRSFPDPATKHALILEAVAEGLAGIERPEPILPSGKVEVEPVEAIITVVKELPAEDAPPDGETEEVEPPDGETEEAKPPAKTTPKGKRGKE